MLTTIKSALLCCAFCLVLTGCAGTEKSAVEPDVQDINPGEKSIIQPPSQPIDNPSRLQERNI